MQRKTSAKKNIYLNNPNLPAVDAQFEYTPEMVQEIQKCKDDLLHFANNYFYIINNDEGRQVIRLHLFQKQALEMIRDNRFSLLLFSRQIGKALALDTPVPTPKGWTTMGKIKAGDQVYGSNGQACNVTHAHDTLIDRECYEIVFDSGEKIIADGEHQWFTQSTHDRDKKIQGSVKTTKQIATTLYKSRSNEPNHRILMSQNGVQGTTQDLPIHPYVLGLWLGDGSSSTGSITVGQRDLNETIQNLKCIDQFNKLIVKQYGTSAPIVRITCNKDTHNCSLSALLRKCNLQNNKHIPAQYLIADRQQRLELLRGLIDSDGYVRKSGFTDFTNTNIELVNQVKTLIESLGYKTNYSEGISKLYGKECSRVACVKFMPREKVCKLTYKASRIDTTPKEDSKYRNRWHYIKSVTPVKSVPVRCISVDSRDNLFLVGKQYIPTHNTTIATIYILWHALFNNDQHILVVANKEETAKEIFGRVQLAFEELPNWLKGGVKEYGKEGMQLANGSKIKITTTTTNAGRGSSCNLLFIDETDWIDHNLLNSFWSSVYPIISSSTKSKIIMASTPRDTSGIFYRLYQKSISNSPDNVWRSLVVRWYDVPGRDESWAQQTRAGMDDPTRFKVEFECEFEETGDSTISDSIFEKLKRRCSNPVHVYMDGHYKLWDQPNRNHLYVVGVDVAEGVGQDSTVVQVLDVTDLRQINQVATYVSNVITPSEFTLKLYEILQQWGMPLVLVERNSCGAQVVDNLRKDYQYEGIVSHGARELGRSKIPLGIISHSNTKYDCVTNMRYWMNTMDAVQINDVQAVEELKEFIRYPNGSWKARHGKHDDRVMSLGWGLMILSEKIVHKYFEIIVQDENHRPAVIKPLDYGIKYFINPSSMYVDEASGDVDVLPSMFGHSSYGTDVDDLKTMGWQFIQ